MQISPDPHAAAKFWLDIADKGIKTLALFIGAGWTYLNYLRGRTFKKRLEVEATGELFERAGMHYLLATCRLKNVGLSEFPIQQRGTACTVYALTDTDMRPSQPVDIFASGTGALAVLRQQPGRHSVAGTRGVPWDRMGR